jgi:NAD(P)-dependent dehydrogenase (short-subunit alcohol dehydrogenase family)
MIMDKERKLTRDAVFVTGSSSGIGLACALHLDKLGFHIFGGVRNERDGESLMQKSNGGITPLVMDVTNEASIAAAADKIADTVGYKGLFGLVNNAGIVVGGPLEFLPLSEIRKQFEVNVLGQIAVTQAVLPLLRRARGRIVNIGTIAGRVTSPFIGPYSASKFALEAITDALRVELLPWGIDVSIIEPGAVATPIWRKSLDAAEKTAKNFPPQASDLYGSSLKAFTNAVEKAAATSIDPNIVARAVVHALTTRTPKTRYLVGHAAILQVLLHTILPDRLYDKLVIRYAGLPGKPIT